MQMTSSSASICEDGYFGQDCISPCRYPSFGEKCQYECNCALSKCNHINGCGNMTGIWISQNENSITLKTIKRIQFPWIFFIHAFLFKTLIFYNRIWFKFIFCKDQTYFPLAFKNNIYSTFFSWIAMSCGLIIFMIFPSRKW